MKTSNGFTLLQKTSEIGTYLNKQNVTRSISRIQIHHMYMPDYNTWENTDKKIFDEPHFGRTESLDSYGKNTWNSKSANGKYIAQHFSVFPDGQITTGRSLNSTPIGIKGWNSNAICIEIYGNFDKDEIKDVQKKAVIALVGELCKRFDIVPSATTVRYHAWFTASGTYLGDYNSAKSAKTCPGKKFFGGNTMAAYKKNFLPAIKNYIYPGTVTTPVIKEETTNFKVKVTADVLNIRKYASADSAKVGEIKKGQVYTIVKTKGNWGYLKSGAGWIHLGYTEKVVVNNEFKVRVTTNSLNVRKKPTTNAGINTSVNKGEVYTIVEVQNGWGKLKSGAGWICLSYTERI